MTPTTNKVYSKAISILDTPTFHSLVGNVNTKSGFVDATLYLINILHTFRAPSRMCEPSTAFYNFLAWCGQDVNTALLSVNLQSAIHTCQSKARSQISQKQWLVYTISLDWKSDKQMAHHDLLISLITNLVIAPHCNTPYPPVGQLGLLNLTLSTKGGMPPFLQAANNMISTPPPIQFIFLTTPNYTKTLAHARMHTLLMKTVSSEW